MLVRQSKCTQTDTARDIAAPGASKANDRAQTSQPEYATARPSEYDHHMATICDSLAADGFAIVPQVLSVHLEFAPDPELADGYEWRDYVRIGAIE